MATIGELLDHHVTLEVECVDRLYLNGYVEKLATGCQLKMFLNQHLKKPYASPVLLGQITQDFVRRLKEYAEQHDIPIIEFKHGQDKDEIANRIRQQRKSTRCSGLYWGSAREGDGILQQEGGRSIRVQPR